MSKVWQRQDPPRLSADALVPANVWHPSSFVRSLQLVIQRLWNPRDGPAQVQKQEVGALVATVVFRDGKFKLPFTNC
jgi:hypothetical protein